MVTRLEMIAKQRGFELFKYIYHFWLMKLFVILELSIASLGKLHLQLKNGKPLFFSL